MSRLGRQFFTADNLFLDETAATQRQFDTVEEMNAAMIDAWNAVVGTGDTVWILGNFHAASYVPKSGLVRSLHGTKYLVAGELDKVFQPNALDETRLATRVRYFCKELGFTGVVTGSGIARKIGRPLTLPLRARQDNLAFPVTVSAFPYDTDEVGDRFTRWRPKRPRTGPAPWLLHGHQAEWRPIRDRQFNVGADAWGLQPVDVELVLEMIEEAGA